MPSKKTTTKEQAPTTTDSKPTLPTIAKLVLYEAWARQERVPGDYAHLPRERTHGGTRFSARYDEDLDCFVVVEEVGASERAFAEQRTRVLDSIFAEVNGRVVRLQNALVTVQNDPALHAQWKDQMEEAKAAVKPVQDELDALKPKLDQYRVERHLFDRHTLEPI